MNNRIRVLRAEKGWSQAELAERVHVSRNSINAVENGKIRSPVPAARLPHRRRVRAEDRGRVPEGGSAMTCMIRTRSGVAWPPH